MKIKYNKWVGLVLSQALVFSTFATAAAEPLPGIVPQPLELKASAGNFMLGEKTVVVASKKNQALANYAGHLLGIGVKTSTGTPPMHEGTIVLQQGKLKEDPGKEGYLLTVTPKGVLIRAESSAGLFYGVQTLIQLLPPEAVAKKSAGKSIKGDGKWQIPCVRIVDKPRFGWRGLMIDASRTFQSVAYLKKTIDLMAMFKMNVLHFHLTDDQGWRLEIKKYPELTKKGARFPAKWNEPESRQGFYTQDEIRDLVAYAKNRNITIVPEIEMPGHTLAVLVAYPELSCTGGPFEIHPYRKGPGIHKDIFCAGNEKTFEFLKNVMDEVLELFPSEYIHIGGDEAPKHRWRECAKCQKRIKDEKLRNAHELQSYFINRMGKYLESKGRKFMGWNEILGGGLSPNAGVMSWQGMRGGLIAAATGREAVMTPTSHCYFDYNYGRINSERAYSFEPVPDSVKEEHRKNILGLQANFWSHIDREPHLVDRQLWPRLISIAERGWSAKDVRDWHDFATRLGPQIERLYLQDVKFNPPALVGLEVDRAFVGETEVKLVDTFKSMEIRYTLDGSQPTASSELYTKPIVLKKTATVKARGFLPDGRETHILTGNYKKQTYREPVVGKNTRPGLKCEFRPGEAKSLNDFSKLPLEKTSVEPKPGIPEYAPKNKEIEGAFTLLFRGYVEVPKTGIYTFFTTSDDGSLLLIGDDLVVNNWRGGNRQRSGQVALKAGKHPITVRFKEGRGGEALKASYSAPNLPKQEIPAAAFSH